MFTHTLIHSLSEIPAAQGARPITYFLPKSIETDPAAQSVLLYPLASGHVSQPSKMKLAFNPVPAWCIFYSTKGQGTVTANETQYAMSSSSLLVFDCSFPFTISATSASFEYDIVYFKGAPAPYMCSLLSDTGVFYLPSVSATGLNTALRPLLHIADHTKLTALAFHRYLTDFFSEAAEFASVPETSSSDSVPAYLREVKEYIDDNFYKDISLEELESLFFVNRYRICREFSKYYHSSPIKYLHNVRINHARQLLSDPALKVHEVGYQVGYDTTTRFIEQFKKLTGKTPAVYRNRY
jgi:AraC-like DNA-binding protein